MKKDTYDKKVEVFSHYKGGNLIDIISPLTSQLRTSLRKVAIKCLG